MPGYPDKIIINWERTKGTDAAIHAEHQNLFMLGQEIIEAKHVKQTLYLRDKMRLLCEKYDRAQAAYLKGLRELVSETAEYIDDNTLE